MSAEPGNIPYLLRTVRVGVLATWIVIAAMTALLFLPSSLDIQTGLYVAVIIGAGLGAIVIPLLPWTSSLEGERGMWLFYCWSALDIVLITTAIHATGGGMSPLVLMYGLTTVFFAAAYPVRAQAALLLMTFACYGLFAALGDWTIDAGVTFVRACVLGTIALITGFLARELMSEKRELEHEIDVRKRAEASLAAARDAEVRLRELEVRQQQALEINDEIVQGLAVAKYALELRRDSKVTESIEETLDSAKAMVTRLLENSTGTHPGMLTRPTAPRTAKESYGRASEDNGKSSEDAPK